MVGRVVVVEGERCTILVVLSERNPAGLQRISDFGPFFDPISSDSDSGSGSEQKIRSRHVCAFFIC